ncbi:MAG: molybdopterin-dependent oxidoreductase [Candidatus Binatia bacterium]
MPTLQIDGRSITVDGDLNLIQAAEQLGIEIPHYCYHPGLTIAGNCRMCLVEIEKAPKLQIACNTRVVEGMVVHTQSDRVKQARAAVLEFLLINHPIDCPVCDQAGECKLQDYYMDYDRQESRFALEDKVHKEKALDVGPLIMLDQERCILCTRCTRFLDEVTKTGELGVFARGDHCAIDLFPGRRLDNAYSGNVADICPVGALTNKDFRFRARVWYLERTPSVCAACATGCNIDIHHRRGEMFRFRPRHNAAVNQYWMCDEGRLSYKRYQGEGRLLQPVLRAEDRWIARPWEVARAEVVRRIRAAATSHGAAAVAGIVSAQATNEEVFLFGRLMREAIGGRLAGWSWSPPDASRDDFLIDADKNPNSAGLRVLASDAEDSAALLADASAGRIRVLILLRTDLAASHGDAFVTALADAVDYVVLLDTHFSATAEIADAILPIASFAEVDGTFVNRQERVQRIRSAIRPPGEARAAWLVLSELRAALDDAAVPFDARAVFTELAAVQPRFRHLSLAHIGDLGMPLDAPPER